ncbi:deoxyribonuclease IV [Verrucomicrobiota bacterium sgz303538]
MSPAPRRRPAKLASQPLLGAHVSIAGGVDKAVDRALSIGCTAMQIFVKSNMQWFARAPFSEDEVREFHKRSGELGAIFGHSGYMINLAAANPEFLIKSRHALREELLRADQLGLPFLVLHPGAHMGAGVETGLKKVVESLDAVFQEIPQVHTRVALETTAGQGSCLGAEFEHLAYILQHVREPQRLCICIDTAHLFAAGYDISSPEKAAAVMQAFDRIVGLEHLCAMHLNDSKAALGSHVDRHEHIGKGLIGIEGFRYFMSAPKFAKVPKVLETPKGKEMNEDVENMTRLRALCEVVTKKKSRSHARA